MCSIAWDSNIVWFDRRWTWDSSADSWTIDLGYPPSESKGTDWHCRRCASSAGRQRVDLCRRGTAAVVRRWTRQDECYALARRARERFHRDLKKRDDEVAASNVAGCTRTVG